MRDIRDPNDPRHGTYRGWQAHHRAKGAPACDPCTRAHREYNAKYDLGRPEVPCQICGTRCRSRYALCATCRADLRLGQDEPVKCVECGTYTITRGDHCSYCRNYGAGTLTDADLLLDGWWVRKGLTLRWVAAA